MHIGMISFFVASDPCTLGSPFGAGSARDCLDRALSRRKTRVRALGSANIFSD